MEIIRTLMIKQTYNERLKYDEYLRKVEEVKFQMAERYRLHPNNFVTKENRNDFVRDSDMPLHLCRNRSSLVEWDERRIDTIGSNGNSGEHYYEF
jgi:hypothetical protein